MGLLLLGLPLLAAAAIIPPILPSAEPADVREVYREQAAQQGRTGPALELACDDLAERLVLCFTYVEAGTRRYVTGADLARWELTADRLVAHARAGARGGLTETRPAVSQIPDMEGRYWQTEAGDGLDAAALVWPEELERRLGAHPVVAVPGRGSLLAWIPGDRSLDTVMAVGARKMFQAAATPVSPLVYQWVEGEWRVWGEVRKTDPAQDASPAAP